MQDTYEKFLVLLQDEEKIKQALHQIDDNKIERIKDIVVEIEKEREDKRRAEAIIEMKRLAKENGLVITTKKKPPRKSGRR